MPNITVRELNFLEYYVTKLHKSVLESSEEDTRDYEDAIHIFDLLYKRQRRINEYQRERKYK